LLAGDGRLGLLIAQLLALKAPGRVTHFGRHEDKMALVAGTAAQVVVTDATAAEHAGAFSLVVEASGVYCLVVTWYQPPAAVPHWQQQWRQLTAAFQCRRFHASTSGRALHTAPLQPRHPQQRPQHAARRPSRCNLITLFAATAAAAAAGAAGAGSASSIRTALALTRPMGSLVLKTTVSLHDPAMPGWSELANDIVVNEKMLVGSRWGGVGVAAAVCSSFTEVCDTCWCRGAQHDSGTGRGSALNHM
jgi:threonine dehydrogenase-like Zn-dependent dehydrogenase